MARPELGDDNNHEDGGELWVGRRAGAGDLEEWNTEGQRGEKKSEKKKEKRNKLRTYGLGPLFW